MYYKLTHTGTHCPHMRNIFTRINNLFKALRHRYTMPLRLELSIVDHCNLNCKGCTHYCPIAPEHFMPLSQLRDNLTHLSAVNKLMFKSIYILGGEPLLHPDISEVCRLTRRLFPSTEIKILTNGIKVSTMDPEFWQACHDTDTTISVTVYPVKVDYDEINRLCEAHGVQYEIFHEEKDGYFFSKHTIDDRNPTNRYINFIRCYQVGCLTLRDDRIFPCATSAYADFINKRFNRDFKHMTPAGRCRNGDYVDVKSVKSHRDLTALYHKPTPFCRYCTKLEPMQWGHSHSSESEWLP